MMNVVLHHSTAADLLKMPPCQYLREKIGVIQFCIGMYRGHYVPVVERPYPFLAAVDVFQLGFVGASSIVVHFEREGEREIIPISSTTYDSPMLVIAAFPTEYINFPLQQS